MRKKRYQKPQIESIEYHLESHLAVGTMKTNTVTPDGETDTKVEGPGYKGGNTDGEAEEAKWNPVGSGVWDSWD